MDVSMIEDRRIDSPKCRHVDKSVSFRLTQFSIASGQLHV